MHRVVRSLVFAVLLIRDAAAMLCGNARFAYIDLSAFHILKTLIITETKLNSTLIYAIAKNYKDSDQKQVFALMKRPRLTPKSRENILTLFSACPALFYENVAASVYCLLG